MNDKNNKIIKYVYSGSYDKYGGSSIYYMYCILNGKDKIVKYNDCYGETDKLKFVKFGDMNFSDKLKNKLKINDNKKQARLKESLDDNSCLIFRNRDGYIITLTASEVLNLIAIGQ